MTNELAISNDELLAATGEDQQQGSGIIKYVKLLQEHKDDIAGRYKNMIELHPENKEKLQAEMLKEIDQQIPLGSYITKIGVDKNGVDIIKNLGKPFIGQILKTRYSWSTKFKVIPAYHTSETDIQGGLVDVYNSDNEKIDTLLGTMLKAKYPEIKMCVHLYVFEATEKVLYKITARGGSLGSKNNPELHKKLWFSYVKSFPQGVSKASFETIFDSEKTDDGSGNEYYAMTFKRGSAIEDTKTTMAMLDDLNALLRIKRTPVEQNAVTMSPAEAVAALASPRSITAASAPVQATSTTIQGSLPKLRERKRMIEEASGAAEKRAEKESDDMPDDFLKPDKE